MENDISKISSDRIIYVCLMFYRFDIVNADNDIDKNNNQYY